MCACFVVCQCEITDGDRGHHGKTITKKQPMVQINIYGHKYKMVRESSV